MADEGELTRLIQSQLEPFVNHMRRFRCVAKQSPLCRGYEPRQLSKTADSFSQLPSLHRTVREKIGGMASRHPAQKSTTQLTAMLAAKRCDHA
jgi:hypothetical protein